MAKKSIHICIPEGDLERNIGQKCIESLIKKRLHMKGAFFFGVPNWNLKGEWHRARRS